MRQGDCLCGRVSIFTDSSIQDISICHCSMCRKWNNSPFMSIDCGANLKIKGEEYITRYTSSDWGERCFCSECGTHLFYYLNPSNQYYVSAGLFKLSEQSRLVVQIYTDCKPNFYNFAEKTPMLTEQDILKMFTKS
ncbi:GFA family protein [Proteus mirabilis]|uniref:GFA family protein n=1 Tax=Proteus mirabilis TaxID=584 RepID=UPI0011ECE964|nr:GFA family protein [Proteus mirabilis]EKU2830655.1 GFA family protein [Proteus mirabilis]QEK48256.1 GFA family protein [Proteus mirabilis]HEI8496984.1 GFA family protein [Proteus mirabilis]HEK1186534.1 GFA family protein [Proteus mirabilis]HEK1981581.1 GFA family protein [Proteus mirabilis]